MSDLHSHGYKESFSLWEKDDDDDAFEDDPGIGKPRRLRGKYRGTVMTNFDPLGQGRLIVRVTDATGFMTTGWALPCVPFAGPLMGMYIVPPPIGAGVWVEFEQGNPDHPIWVGCFWPPDPPVPPGQAGIMAQTATKMNPGGPLVTMEVPGAGIGVSALPVAMASVPGNVTLFVAPATSITLSPTGITMTAPTVTINAAKINVTGATSVNGVLNVNGTSLVVT
ncbi:MAG: hypothetical protein QOI39_3990 [Mycobacterium sp.]|jgi:hypothetical protein|nr:hypothetical protein [Mycobacterium sp.]